MIKRSSLSKIFSCVCAVSLLFVNFAFAAPVTAATVQEQIKELEDEQKELQKQIAAAKDDLASSKAKRDLYYKQISNVQNQISLLDGQISTLNGQISAKNAQITDMEKQIADNRAEEDAVRQQLGERLNAIAKRGNLSTIQMLMSTESYADYLIKEKLMEQIAANDQAAIDALEEKLADIHQAEEKVKTEKADIEAKKADIEKLRASSTAKKNEINVLYTKANAVYKKDKSEVDALNKELQETENSIQRLLASLNSTGVYTTMYWPVPTVRAISSPFGTRWGTLHKGIDIANGPVPVYGQDIVAAADGTVIFSWSADTWGGGYGYYCMVDHGLDSKGRQIVTLYAHCSAMYARVGQKVTGGKTVLAKAGATGNVTGPHLHFEVRVNGTPVDPLKGYVSINGK
ncbi:MAG: peptidoglycan DD-metalloendopeptidase family protein, partial [Elusimicrobiaceae bacterium]|nr:peptidoglycan DD-metalloendopeptidase family protein [Clostridia bacterium]MBP3514494.1 peptidoglycan DD-metalloendopeptidase family protein [Elusimicrobiaceae bacterium]